MKGRMDLDKTAVIFLFNDNLEVIGFAYEKQTNEAMLTIFCA